MTLCTSSEAIQALGYLTRCFGGFAIPDDEQRAFLRLFRHFEPEQVSEAIDDLVRRADRRPSPNELATALRRLRPVQTPFVALSDPLADEVTPETFRARMAEVRARIAHPVPTPDEGGSAAPQVLAGTEAGAL